MPEGGHRHRPGPRCQSGLGRLRQQARGGRLAIPSSGTAGRSFLSVGQIRADGIPDPLRSPGRRAGRFMWRGSDFPFGSYRPRRPHKPRRLRQRPTSCRGSPGIVHERAQDVQPLRAAHINMGYVAPISGQGSDGLHRHGASEGHWLARNSRGRERREARKAPEGFGRGRQVHHAWRGVRPIGTFNFKQKDNRNNRNLCGASTRPDVRMGAKCSGCAEMGRGTSRSRSWRRLSRVWRLGQDVESKCDGGETDMGRRPRQPSCQSCVQRTQTARDSRLAGVRLAGRARNRRQARITARQSLIRVSRSKSAWNPRARLPRLLRLSREPVPA